MSNATRNSSSPTIATQRELASRLQRSPSRVCRWMQRKDWPFGPPPWPAAVVERVRQWATTTLREGGDDDPGLRALKVEKLRQEICRLSAMADGAEADNASRAAALYAADDVRGEYARVGDQIRSAFTATPARVTALALAHGMPADATADFAAQARASVDAILAPLDGPFRLGRATATDGPGRDDDGDDDQHGGSR